MKNFFITNFKAFVKIKTEIENGMTMTNLHKHQIFVQKLSIKIKKGIGLKEIENVTDQRGFINKTENCKLERKKFSYRI